MATNFPGSQDSFTNPTSSDTLDSPDHAAQHADVNDAVEAIELALLDGAPLHIDDANERVGVGTASPSTELEVDGTVTATEFVGDIQGASHIQVKNTSGGSLSKGTPVYATGSVGASGAVEVQASLAGTASTMPALGLLDETLASNAEGSATVLGVIRTIDTSSYSVNDELYVAVSGGLTNTRPTGASELVQKIGRVVRSDASTGEILVLGAGRSNDVPNDVVAGGLTIDTDTLHVDAANDRVGIGTTSPVEELHVVGDVFMPDGGNLWIGNNADSGGRVRLHHSTNGTAYFDYYDSLYFRSGSTSSANRVTFTSGGNVGINDTTPSYTLDVNGTGRFTGALDANTQINLDSALHLTQVDTDGSMRVQGNNGYIDIGPKNTTYCHIYTDRGSFYFNKSDLYAASTNRKIWHRGDLRGGAVSVAVNSTGYGTINHGLGATPDFAFVGARQRLSNGNDNQLSFPITSYNSTSITFRAYEINGDGNSNYTSSTIYNATVYVFWMAGNQ